MKRTFALFYGVFCYGVFFATFLYAIGFIGSLWVPKSIDSVPTAPLTQALLIDLCLLAIFALQHSVMARPAFKRWWTQYVPRPVERSTYVLASSLALILLFALWEPIGGVIWHVESDVLRISILVAYGLGWGLVLLSTFLINHFDLFGLRQTWLYFRGRPYTDLGFVTPGPYRYIRHPLYLGWLIVLWASPTMTAAHLVFALMSTIYIFIGIRLEERDLADVLPEYETYRSQVPMILPTVKRLEDSRTDDPGTAAASAG